MTPGSPGSPGSPPPPTLLINLFVFEAGAFLQTKYSPPTTTRRSGQEWVYGRWSGGLDTSPPLTSTPSRRGPSIKARQVGSVRTPGLITCALLIGGRGRGWGRGRGEEENYPLAPVAKPLFNAHNAGPCILPFPLTPPTTSHSPIQSPHFSSSYSCTVYS